MTYLLAGAYSTKDVASFEISRGRLFGELTGNLPAVDESDNYALVANFAQYLWVDDDSAAVFEAREHATKARHHSPPLGVGVFARAGWAPEDRNAIDQFYSFGFGGYGMVIPGRNDDNWGIGWAGSHISDDLRQLTGTNWTWEHAFEVFYNVAVTPAVHLSLDAQSIRPALGYTVHENDKGFVELYAGARYLWIETDLTIDLAPLLPGSSQRKTSPSDSNWDAVVGVRGSHALNDKWAIPYSINGGGGDSDFTWKVQAAAAYNLGGFDAVAGWRYLYYDVGSDTVIRKLSVNGPFVGAMFHW